MTPHNNSSTNPNIGIAEAMSTMSVNNPTMPFHSTSPSPDSHGTAGSSAYSDSLPDDAAFDSNRGHIQEVERIVELAGPNNQYAKLNTILGRGAYKTVWKALDREEGIEVAWNIIETAKNEYSELVQETEILKKVRHPNVIHFYDSWYANGEFVFITELMTSGTLREYIKKFKNPSMKIIKRWSRQILKGLNYLHSQSPPIIHRDIKCDNIFTPIGIPTNPPITKGSNDFNSKLRLSLTAAIACPFKAPKTAIATANCGLTFQAQNDIATKLKANPDNPCTNPATIAPIIMIGKFSLYIM